jgi:uncharacterized protein
MRRRAYDCSPPDDARAVSVLFLPLSDAVRRSSARAVAALAAIMLALCAPALPAQSWETGTDGLLPIPPLSAHVTDLTQTLLPAEKQSLETKLADWEARTTNQLAVLIVPTTQPEPIEAYSIRVAEKWQIGHKGKDNGVLLLVAKNDKKMRIEAGYGLEGTLTDVTSRRIIAESIAPLFRDGKFAAGIDAGVDRIIAVVAEGKPLPPRKTGNVARSSGGSFDFGTMLLILFIVVPVVGRILRAIFGKLLGSTIGAGIVGAAAWFVAGSIVIAVIAVIVAFAVMIFAGTGSALTGRRGGMWLPTGGGWSGGGGGTWSGGGGGFGGGGASGGWN